MQLDIQTAPGPIRLDEPPIQRPGRIPYLMSAALGVVAAAAAGLTVAFPSALSGVAGANGNLRGTALVVLAVGLPVLAAALVGSRRGSTRAFVIWLGTLGYLLYQAVLLCFATPFNSFFLFYVAYLGLAVWSIVLLLRGTDLSSFGLTLSPRLPIRRIAGFALVVMVVNAAAWLSGILPAVLSDNPGAFPFLTETGLLTNPVYIQDLAIWLPLLATAAVAAWRDRVWGQLVTAAMLTMFVLECISISTDQYFGTLADPTTSSMTMVPAFAAAALIMAVPLVVFLRNVDRRQDRPSGTAGAPPAV